MYEKEVDDTTAYLPPDCRWKTEENGNKCYYYHPTQFQYHPKIGWYMLTRQRQFLTLPQRRPISRGFLVTGDNATS